MSDFNQDHFAPTFVAEALELLDSIAAGLKTLQTNEVDQKLLRAMIVALYGSDRLVEIVHLTGVELVALGLMEQAELDFVFSQERRVILEAESIVAEEPDGGSFDD